MQPRKEIEEQLCLNESMIASLPDTVVIGDAIRTLARIMLDVRDLLQQIDGKLKKEK